MSELLDIVDAFSTPLKIAWGVWLAWGIGQLAWYRQERKPSTAGAAVPARTQVARKAALSAEPPMSTRLVTPEPSFEAVAPPEPVEPMVPQLVPPQPGRPVATDDGFDPSRAVVESFHATASDFEKFVADFERHDGHSHDDRDSLGSQHRAT